MDELRLILLGLGVVFIALIYLWGMRNHIKASIRERRRRRAAMRSLENEPVLKTDEDEAILLGETGSVENPAEAPVEPIVSPEPPDVSALSDTSLATEPKANPVTRGTSNDQDADRKLHIEPGIAEEPTMTVLLSVMAPPNKTFDGIQILEAAQEANLKLNKRGTLDCFAETEAGPRRLFRVGHLKEPGIFSLQSIDTLKTPGLLLFMSLPGPVETVAGVDLLIAVAGQLAESLGGAVCDERHNKLSAQAMVHLRSEAAEFQRRQRVWAQQPRD